MVFKSKAPLRIGLAGGGTDVSPYADLYGGAVINVTISHYASAEITPLESDVVELFSADRNETFRGNLNEEFPITGSLDLLKGMHNCILRDYGPFATGFRLSTTVDAPLGSGLGTSSTLMVAIVGVFFEMLKIPPEPFKAAQYAYDAERKYLLFPGGKQDQYAAAFGGINYMEFKEGTVDVKPIVLSRENTAKLENNLLLYYTGINRESSFIIREQMENVNQQNQPSISAMHSLKHQSEMMKEALSRGDIDEIGPLLDMGFTHKRKMAAEISNPLIEEIYTAAVNAGASGGKISGAGGGGFMIFYCPDNSRQMVCDALHNFGGSLKPFTFSYQGMTAWTELK